MRVPPALLTTTMLAIVGTACSTPTSGTPQATPKTVTVVSTVTATPTPGSGRVFKAQSVERGVSSILRDDYKFDDVGAVGCPAEQPVIVGTTFACTVQLGEDIQEVIITVKTGDGEYEVGQPR